MSEPNAVQVVIVDTPGLGDRGYIVHDGLHAMVIDPQRDTDRIDELIIEHGLTVTHVAETHIHNDYVTGGYHLAAAHQARYVVPSGVDLAFLGQPNVDVVGNGSTFGVGELEVAVVHTPGHTPHHISFAVSRDGGSGDGLPGMVFTGGSLLYGTVGRPDLVSPEATVQQAADQWHSAHKLVDQLDGQTRIYPTHGFGSFCSSIQTTGTESSLEQERQTNPALTQTESDFVDMVLAGLDVFPAYYAHMGPANAAGPTGVDLSAPEVADGAELRRRIEVGEWVVDLRSRAVFMPAHVPGSINVDLSGSFVNYLGWMIPWGTPLTLIGDTREQVATAQREIVRIGIDRPVRQAVGDVTSWMPEGQSPASIRRIDFATLAAEWQPGSSDIVLDTRQILEWESGHIKDATFMPFYDVAARMNEIPRQGTVYVHCGSGYRASVVVSLMRILGWENVVHVADAFGKAAAAGLEIVSEEAPEREPGWTWTASRAGVRTFTPGEVSKGVSA
ncbi:MAG: MBL fold metallo-hydrolase [Actinomycetota bacterium]|nr:MBL fold metallo-hydrolase [Actinomycetota bacterium]